ncbi:hypothetical protein [Gorillibacterium sp. sgz5001074]|uniref:hypothetical protein n=1 Tax=Gorillibacterium sp. sgz5001074 TaxID=3446695 RepID=UPI003F66A5C5
MEMERSNNQTVLGQESKAWSGSWMEVAFWSAVLTSVGALFRLEGWEFGITAALLALFYPHLAGASGRSALFVFYGIAGLAAALWLPAPLAAAISGVVALGAGFATASSATAPAERMTRILSELGAGLAAAISGILLLVRSQDWVYQPVQLAAAIFCVLLLVITRNRLLSVGLSAGLVLLAALHGQP